MFSRQTWIDGIRAIQPYGELAIVAASQLSVAVAGLVGIKLLTGVLTPASFGELAMALSVTGFLQQLWIGPLTAAVRRFWAAGCEDGHNQSNRNTLWTMAKGLVRLIAQYGTMLAITAVVVSERYLALLIVLTATLSILSVHNEVFHAVHVASRHRVITSGMASLNHWSRVSLAATVAFWCPGQFAAAAALFGMGLSSAILALVYHHLHRSAFKTTKVVTPAEGLETGLGNIRDYSRHLTRAGACSAINTAAPRWILWAATNESQVGLYAACFQLGHYPLWMVFMTLTEYAMPYLFVATRNTSSSAGNDTIVRDTLRITGVVGTVGVAAIVVAINLHDRIFDYFTSATYAPSAALLPIVTVTTCITYLAESLGLAFLIKGSPQQLTVIRVGLAGVGIVAGSVGAMAAGLHGVLIAGLIQSVLLLILFAFAFARNFASL